MACCKLFTYTVEIRLARSPGLPHTVSRYQRRKNRGTSAPQCSTERGCWAVPPSSRRVDSQGWAAGTRRDKAGWTSIIGQRTGAPAAMAGASWLSLYPPALLAKASALSANNPCNEPWLILMREPIWDGCRPSGRMLICTSHESSHLSTTRRRINVANRNFSQDANSFPRNHTTISC